MPSSCDNLPLFLKPTEKLEWAGSGGTMDVSLLGPKLYLNDCVKSIRDYGIGGAWSFFVGGLSCPVYSDNERVLICVVC